MEIQEVSALRSGGKWLFTVLFVSKILFSDINKFMSSSANAAYMQVLWQGTVAAAVFVVLWLISGDDGDILTGVRKTFGRGAEAAAGGAVSLLILAESGIMLKTFSDVIASIALPEASSAVIAAVVSATASVAVFCGVAPLGAYCRGAGIAVAAGLCAVCALNLPNCTASNLYPVFGNGARGIFAPDGLEIYADILLIFVAAPYFKSKREILKTGLWAIVISASLTALCTLFYVLTTPYPSHFSLPVLEIAFGAKLDFLFRRAEGIFLFLWIFSSFTVTAVYTALSADAFARSFNISDKRALTPIFALLPFSAALLLMSSPRSAYAYDKAYTAISLLALLAFFAVFAIGKRRRRE